MKNSPFLSCGGWNKDAARRLGFGAAAQFFGWPPIGAAFVQRIEDYVAAFGIIEPFYELACGVINDGRISPVANLPEHLKHERGLARTSVADDLHVLGLGTGRDAKHVLHVIGLEADAVAFYGLVELPRRQHLRALQPAAIL